MYFVVELKNGDFDFLKDVISISMDSTHCIDFKTNEICWNAYDIDNIVSFRQITENEYFLMTKNN